MKTVFRERWEPYDPEDANDISPLFAFLVQYVSMPDTWIGIPYATIERQLDISRPEIFEEIKRLHYDWYLSSWNLEGDTIPKPTDDRIFVKIEEVHYRLVVFEESIRETLSAELRAEIHQRFNHTCVYCGEKSEEIDHVIPVSRGGSDDRDNLVASCQHCNRRKSDRLLSEIGWGMEYANV